MPDQTLTDQLAGVIAARRAPKSQLVIKVLPSHRTLAGAVVSYLQDTRRLAPEETPTAQVAFDVAGRCSLAWPADADGTWVSRPFLDAVVNAHNRGLVVERRARDSTAALRELAAAVEGFRTGLPAAADEAAFQALWQPLLAALAAAGGLLEGRPRGE